MRDLDGLPPARRRIIGYEAAAPCRYDPSHGFGEIPPLVARPGETAEAEGKVLRCPRGRFPAFYGSVPVSVRADDPSAARATFSFIKRYAGAVPTLAR